MGLIENFKQHVLTAGCWWAAACAVFFVLTRLWPCNPGRSWWKAPRAALADLFYGILLVPLVGLVGRFALLWVGVMLFFGKDAAPEFAARGWPLWLQCALVLIIQDALMYWIHRLFHTRPGWEFHAVHHSPETLDWTSASRFHPVNEVAQYALVDAAVLLMGFSPVVLAVLGPFQAIYSALVHANLNWTFGPLRYVLASPVFHRWHHSSQAEALGKNFAPTFPFFDLLWGTFHMPAGVVPEEYGANELAMPAGPVGQTLFPFRGAGRWALRRPALATACALACAGLGYSAWQYLSRPVEQEVVELPEPEGRGEPPGRLPPTVVRDAKQTNAVAVDATGDRAIYGLRDGSVSVRDTSGRESSPARHKSRVNGLATSPGGKWAVSASSDGTALVFGAGAGEAGRVLPHGGANVLCAAVSDDGWVVTGASDGTLRLWDPTGALAKERKLEAAPVNAVGVSGGGRRVVAGQGLQVSTWEVAADRLTRHRRLGDLAYCVDISEDGRRVAAGEYGGQLHLWDAGEERPRAVVKGHAGPIYSLRISPDGESVVTGGADRVVRVWDAKSGSVAKELHGHRGMIFSVSRGAGGRRILAGGKDGSLTCWDVPSGVVVPAAGSQSATINR
jgi:sterol desaturase/sphingolipid hydroxylase (fatty acid hydroxylase superfamily)